MNRPGALALAVLSILALLAAGCSDSSDDGGAVDASDDDAATESAESGDDTSEDDDAAETTESAEATDGDADDDGGTDDAANDADTDAGDAADGPQAIVSMSPTATEMLFAIGAGDRVIAADSYSNYPAEAPTTDLEAFSPNLEAIAGYEPDLVVLAYDPGEVVSGLEVLGIETILVPDAVTIEDSYAQMADLGVATGEIDGAAEAVAEMRAEMEAVTADAADLGGLRVYHELDDTFYSVSSSTFIGEIYTTLGMENVADEADDGSGYPQLSAEYLLEADPQVIIVPDQVTYTADDIAARPGWDTMSAVADGRVLYVDADIASRWGPRTPEFAATIVEALQGAAVGG